MNDEIALIIWDTLSGKYVVSEIEELIKKELAGVITGIYEVDNVQIIITFDMG